MTRHFDAEEQIVSGSQDALPDAPSPVGVEFLAVGEQTTLRFVNGALFVNGVEIPAESVSLELEGKYLNVHFSLKVK